MRQWRCCRTILLCAAMPRGASFRLQCRVWARATCHLRSHDPCEESLSGAWRSHHQDARGEACPCGSVSRRVLEHGHHLLHFLLGRVDAGHVVKGETIRRRPHRTRERRHSVQQKDEAGKRDAEALDAVAFVGGELHEGRVAQLHHLDRRRRPPAQGKGQQRKQHHQPDAPVLCEARRDAREPRRRGRKALKLGKFGQLRQFRKTRPARLPAGRIA
eukprot:scaffold3218_cov99-Isochrysis_galbana.AAC.3